MRRLLALVVTLTAPLAGFGCSIVAHSAGNPIVVGAMRDLRLMHYQADKSSLRSATKIGRVVLAAPDMDLLQAINATLDGFDECAESDPWVSSDIGLYLTLGLTAQERGLERDGTTGFWVFPADYEARLRRAELGVRSAQQEVRDDKAS